jgi:hypothetical protein
MEGAMLFSVVYTSKHIDEEADKRSIDLFKSWTPPAGFEFKSHYSFADGSGGVAIVDVASPEAMLEGLTPWQPFHEFEAVPVVEISAAVPIIDRVNTWRDSVG